MMMTFDATQPQAEALIADARRAAEPGAIGTMHDRADALIVTPPQGGVLRTLPSASPLSVAIEGPGLFVLEENGSRLYGRLGNFSVRSDGSVCDAQARNVMAFRVDTAGHSSGELVRLSVARKDARHKRFAAYTIDEHGVFSGISRRIDARSGARVQTVENLGRIALAVFPAPERLERVTETTLRAAKRAGTPLFVAPGTLNVGKLRPHALEAGLVDLHSDLAQLWRVSRRSALQSSVAAASDACSRTTLGLVK
ncbi:MAG: hypothetical protein M3007_07940 [Candidatus Eremiobacteraeota bacterium]|nr:hypothetical protein [Candidatus Eremiobacteraeota bacterium]